VEALAADSVVASAAVAAEAGSESHASTGGLGANGPDQEASPAWGRQVTVKRSVVLVVLLLAAACSSSSTGETVFAEQVVEATVSVEASPPAAFELLPEDGQTSGATGGATDPEPPDVEVDTDATAGDAQSPVPATTPLPTPTVVPRDPSIAWTAAESTRDMVNYLEALRAGAYEQAAWPAFGNGILLDGQTADETGAEFLARSCAGDLCVGPYLVQGQPGFIDPDTMVASAVVVVTHLASGQQTRMPIVTFQGQRIIGNLPPLVAGTNESSFRETLFGASPPQYVVVERFEAFEIWDGDGTQWLTHFDAETATQIEGDVVVGSQGAFAVSDPEQILDLRCAQLIERAGEVLSIDGCVTDEWALVAVATGAPVDALADFPRVGESQTAWMTERGGTVLASVRDAEGNLAQLLSSSGVDLLDGDQAGTTVLSTDGAHVAYVDHSDPAAASAFWSSVVVVRDIATGNEVGRWTLDGSVICLEFAVQWVIACEADDSTLVFGDPDQRSLVAINITSGETNAVPTANRVFLPVRPAQ